MDKERTLIDRMFYFDEKAFDAPARDMVLRILGWLHWKVFEAFIEFWDAAAPANILGFSEISTEFRKGLSQVVGKLTPPEECFKALPTTIKM